MIKFKDFIAEGKAKGKTIAFMRVNPVQPGHVKVFDKVRTVAKKQGDDHEVVLSSTHEPKKNPLSPEQKLEHARAASPETNISVASKSEPTIMHHAARAHAEGYHHLTVVAGQDRVGEFHDLLHKYNGVKPKKEGAPYYNFKSIKVVSAGKRDPDAEGVTGMSGTKMREHAAAGRKKEFMSGVPNGVDGEKMYNHVRKGMGIDD